MKKIQLIVDLLERAEKKGAAVKRARRRNDWGYSYVLGDLEEVYRVVDNRVDGPNKTVSLFHYGTLIARVDLKSMRLVDIYGESRSDVDSINTFLTEFGFENFSFGFKPVNGGFYLMTFKDEKRQETFLNQGKETVIKEFNSVQKGE